MKLLPAPLLLTAADITAMSEKMTLTVVMAKPGKETAVMTMVETAAMTTTMETAVMATMETAVMATMMTEPDISQKKGRYRKNLILSVPALLFQTFKFYFVSSIIISLLRCTNAVISSGFNGLCASIARS